jgi:hypothetical protein
MVGITGMGFLSVAYFLYRLQQSSIQILLVKRWVEEQANIRILAQGLCGFLITPKIKIFSFKIPPKKIVDK